MHSSKVILYNVHIIFSSNKFVVWKHLFVVNIRDQVLDFDTVRARVKLFLDTLL